MFLFLVPGPVAAQGRDPKVYYDDGISAGSKDLQRFTTTYFELLTTPSPDDPDCALLREWAPRLDRYFENVADNLHLTRAEVYRYLLYPEFFAELEKLQLEGRLPAADFDRLLRLATAAGDSGAALPTSTLDFVSPPDPKRIASLRQRSYGDHIVVVGDSVHVRMPGPSDRNLQRCILYRTLHDFMATPIGPRLPEGVLGFVPRHDPERPVVIYASLGEQRLARTAQHEIGHAVVEGVSVYLRSLSVTRLLHAPKDTAAAKPWRPASGGFAAVTHENYAEYLAFPHGRMDPALRAALVEMVADDAIDGLAAMSVGARTMASSYIEGPARLTFLAETFGADLPKRLLVTYYTGGRGFLDVIEDLTGKSMPELESLYRRWLRRRFWDQHLATDVPDTLGTIAAGAWSGVRRDGLLLVTRARDGRQEVALLSAADRRHRKGRARAVVRDLDGAERLPIFSTPDLRAGIVVTSARDRDAESLVLYDVAKRTRWRRPLSELGAVREVRDPRLSTTGRAVVCRVVDRAGRNGIALYDRGSDRARMLVPWQWAEVADPSFAGGDSIVLFTTTDTPDRSGDLRLVDVATGRIDELTQTPNESETEPIEVRGHLVYLSDRDEYPAPWVAAADGRRRLLHLPFPVERLQASDSSLALVAVSLRHRTHPGGRAVWEFPHREIGLDAEAATTIAALALPARPPAAGDGGVIEVAAASPTDRVEADLRPAAEPADGTPHGTASAALRPWLVSGEPLPTVTRYKQKWRMLPIGLNLTSSTQRGRGLGFFGFASEFNDQSVIVAAGQSGRFDRFGLAQYRNTSARTHWQVAAYDRSIVRRRYGLDSLEVFDRRENERGVLFSAQYHKSLVTRIGAGVSLSYRTQATGRIEADVAQTLREPLEAPVLGLELGGLRPRSWQTTWFGVSRLGLLRDRSPAALGEWTAAARTQAATEERFVAEQEYVRPSLGLGTSLSRDTRVWADYRGPHSGTLLVLDVSGGVHAPGHTTTLTASGDDSVRVRRGAGLERLAGSWLLVTHRRAGFVDLALRCRGLLNDGPQALVYGLGGIYSVSGYPTALVRSHGVAWTNAEARVQLWDYSAWRVPFRGLVFPAADGFVYTDAGVARGVEPLCSWGVGLRLRLGFLAFEWRKALRAGHEDQRGISLLW
jgi:hypothetical protein